MASPTRATRATATRARGATPTAPTPMRVVAIVVVATARGAMAAKAPVAYPRALRGSFRGEWWLDGASASAATTLTRDGWRRGTCALTLRTTFDADARVHGVVADATFRESEYIGKGDAHVPLEGVYAETTGGLYAHGAAKTTKDMLSARNASDRGTWREMSAYRASVRAVANDILEGMVGGSETAEGRNPALGARDSYRRDSGVARAGKSARAMFVGAHDAGVYPMVCQFKLHAYVTPGSYSLADTTQKRDATAFDDVDVLEAQVEDMRPLEFADMAEKTSLVGKFVSENCGLTVHVALESQKLEHWYRQARLYSYAMIAAALAQGYVLGKQIEVGSTQAAMMRMSLASIGMRSVVDSYLCLAHLTGGILVDDLFMPLALVALCYFVLFSILEMRLLIAAWRARTPDITNWIELRVNLGAVYSRFYAGFISGLFAMYWLSDRFIIFLLLANSYWVPQIVRNAYHNHRQALKPWYVVTTSFMRLSAPLYVLGCPSNFLKIRPNYFHCAVMVAWTTAQTAMLLAQYYINPRYGFPIGIFPEVYDYHRKVSEEVLAQCGVVDEDEDDEARERDVEMGDVAAGPDCVICMNPVKFRAVHDRMVTPCNHFFHTKCLMRWMDIKQECPTCRGALPPM